MARGATATIKDDEDGAGAAGERRAGKRRCVQAACVPCRKRKSKCDGGTPVCATCTAVYKTPCCYDADSEGRRSKTATKRDAAATALSSSLLSPPAAAATSTTTITAGTITSTTTSTTTSTASTAAASDGADFLVAALRSLPEADVLDLVQHMRKHTRLDVAALADAWRSAAALPPRAPLEPQSLETELSMLLGKPAMTQSGESRYFGHTSNMSLVIEDENYARPRPHAPGADHGTPAWTAVTRDVAFVERLLDLYFRWSHPFYVVFSRECFYKDFRSGRTKYCSPLLVNAILAYACHFTDDPAGRTDPADFRTAGDHFFDAARRLLYENEASSLTTVQALCVMAMREPSAGRDSSGFSYMGRCMRMAIELGLHLKNSAAPALSLTPSEIEVRKVTFWGCFTVDTIWSICIGRISQLPRVAITLDMPILDEVPSAMHSEAHHGPPQQPPGTITSRMFLQEFSTLSELINDNNYMFYAPIARLTDIRLISCHNKYLEWFKNLPTPLRLDSVLEPQPHIIALHMLYHTAIGHLFRPMLKTDLINFKLKPRDACIAAANSVSELLRQYRSLYPMRTCQLVFTHILLSNGIVHLTFLKDTTYVVSSYRYLVECLQALEDLSVCHWFGARAFRIIYETSKAWDLEFPTELQSSNLIPKARPVAITSESATMVPRMSGGLAPPVSTGASRSPVLSSGRLLRRESLGMFACPDTKPPQLPSQSGPSPGPRILRSQPQPRGSLPHNVSHSPPTPVSHHRDVPSSHAPHANTGSAETLFWNPFPNSGMGAPILPRNSYPVGPMDLDNMLENADEWDRFSRDGFKMSETWNHEQANAYPGSAGVEGYPQTSGEAAFDAGWWHGEGGLER